MTVKELKQKLENMPDDMDVFLEGGKTEFTYALLNSVRRSEITMQEHPDSRKINCDIEVIILDEE